jgi:tRNA modification GTPase
MARAETIFALSSGPLPSAIALLRLSGPQAGAALQSLCGRLPSPRRATRATLQDPSGEALDDAIVLWFPGPASATGEDVAELHVHGGRAVVAALLAALAALPGLRPADPGEFTRRAVVHGKIDLTAAEGIDDLIRAETERQRRQALRQSGGALAERVDGWRTAIIAAMAQVTAAIDFSDEGDVPEDLLQGALADAAVLRADIAAVLADGRQGERLRDGLVVAIAGPPNAGKSTLLNRLARREAAIVSPLAGTTRDVIEVHLALDGYPVTLLDTAGLRETSDPVEQEGVRRARARADAADLVLWLSEDDTRPPGFGSPVWTVRSKLDLGGAAAAPTDHAISVPTGQGIDDLTTALAGFAADQLGRGESGLLTRVRHRQLLEDAVAGLTAAEAAGKDGEELVAEHLRRAADALGRLTGRIDVEDVLDALFREFCIGK